MSLNLIASMFLCVHASFLLCMYVYYWVPLHLGREGVTSPSLAYIVALNSHL